MKTITLSIRSLTSSSPFRPALLVMLAMPACFALSPVARAVTPFPDGGYPGANTAEGDFALQNLSTGNQNTAIGASALAFTTTGSNNTATGAFALNSNTADNNTATGSQALANNTTGTANTAMGYLALGLNTTGHDNTALGYQALNNNTGIVGSGDITGTNNTATGSNALYSNTTGDDNTAVGSQALASNNSRQNTAVGSRALQSNSSGFNNTANGFGALNQNTTGYQDTAIGNGALASNTTGAFNTADGCFALALNTTGSDNIGLGNSALFLNTTGGNNIALGSNAGAYLTTGDNNIDIGNAGVPLEANTIRIGTPGTQKATFIAGIIGAPIAGATVHISGTGQLGIGPPSSVRFKNDIKPMDKASEAILALKPVTFHYKKELDPDGVPQFGLVAEEVEKVSPDLVARDDQGKVYTVRYEAVNAMLLNEFLKEHRTVQELKSMATTQEAIIAQLKSAIAQQQKDFATTTGQQQKEFDSKIAHQQKQIEAITAGLQKVSAQLEVNKPLPRIVVSDQ